MPPLCGPLGMELTSTPKQAKSLERALAQLRAKVVGGELMPGEQIRQQEMAEELGVSRVPLREALNVLADQGLLLHRPNQGYFVAKRSPNEQAEIRRMLQLLEDELVTSIAWPDAKELARLVKLNQLMKEAASSVDWTPLVELNREFHLRIFSLSTYGLILGEVQRLWSLADPFIATKMSLADARMRTVAEHDRILEALRCQDMAMCLAEMEAHRLSTSSGLPPELPGGKAMNLARAR
jgi:DNA-binding GntR family transcriptional regulator